jgi:uncharacterized membrane protein (DUF106 family)
MAIWLMFDTKMRMDFASALGVLLHPAVGFNNAYPVWTIFFAGLIMTIFSTGVRHYFIDWVEMAKTQKIQAAFNKERMDAYRKGDTNKVKRLQGMNVEIMQMNAKNMKSNFKTMAVTMFLVLIMFSWLWLFLSNLENQTFAAPWALDVRYGDNPYLLPNWIFVYTLASLPVGQVLGRVLKHYSYSKKLAALDVQKKSYTRPDEPKEEKDVSSKNEGLEGGGHDNNDRRASGER